MLQLSAFKMAPFRHVGMGDVRKLYPLLKLLICVTIAATLAAATTSTSKALDETTSSTFGTLQSDKPLFFDQLYAEGVKAYNDQLWYKCAYSIETSVKEYKTFKSTLTDCRMKCKKGERVTYLDKMPSDLGEFALFVSFFQHADCFRRCKSDAYEERPGLRLTKMLEHTFESRKPYQYLQYCWYKLDRPKDAASAAYTFYLANPTDEDVKKNIAFYRDKAKVREQDFIDLELKPYKEHYIRALLAYSDHDWANVVDQLEKGIADFLVQEERCRADCEDSNLDLMEPSHFAGIIADHALKVLECQLGCEGNLSIVYTEPVNNFIADQFHYLQYSYYKLDKIQEAVEAIGTFLLLHPNDEVVLENKAVFKKKYKFDDDQFIPRPDAKEYVERRQKIQALLEYLRENMMPDVPDVIFVTNEDTVSDEIKQEQPTKPATDHQAWMERYERLGLHVIAKASDLKRQYRFVADGLLKQEQCEEILTLMDDIEMDRKGVKIFTLQHGRETLIAEDENYEGSLRLFMRATEVMRHYTQRYYNFSQSLFFTNTTMVCWEQVESPEVEDGCIPQEFGTCDLESKLKQSTLVDDHFVTVTYLNTIDDAEVYFLGENVTIDTSLGVKIGRTIGFQLGDRHGLHIPNSASRCAIVITYATYSTPEELDYISTIQTLQQVDQHRMKKSAQTRDEVMQTFEAMGVKIVRNSSTLHGGERFVADGVASNAECTSLKNMVMSGALVGDGYDHLESKPSIISPHTEHETFHGLTIYRAAKLMHMGLVNSFAMQTFLDLSEKGRLLVEKYFNLSSHLYFDFTHLVCRSAVDDSKAREDLSHPVHADNCVLQPNGQCLREYPAFTQRDYSALIYLNDDFDGGEFFFAHWNTTEQVSLQPKCGRIVAFNATQFHGVKAVRRGTRCALALWFTLNPHFKEIAHMHAKKILRNVLAERDTTEKKSKQRGDVANEAKLSERNALHDATRHNQVNDPTDAAQHNTANSKKQLPEEKEADSADSFPDKELISDVPDKIYITTTGDDDNDSQSFGFIKENNGYARNAETQVRREIMEGTENGVDNTSRNSKLSEGTSSNKAEL